MTAAASVNRVFLIGGAEPAAISGLPTSEELERGLHLIVGATASGKTVFSRSLASRYMKDGAGRGALHVIHDTQEYTVPGATHVVTQPDKFSGTLAASIRAGARLVIVDGFGYGIDRVLDPCIAAAGGGGVVLAFHAGSHLDAIASLCQLSALGTVIEAAASTLIRSVTMLRCVWDGRNYKFVSSTLRPDDMLIRLILSGRRQAALDHLHRRLADPAEAPVIPPT